jgi:hypothetical protein
LTREHGADQVEESKPTTTTLSIPTKYEDRLVAFLDILAWREKVNESEKDETLIPKLGGILFTTKLIADMRTDQRRRILKSTTDPKDEERSIYGDVQFAQFSDSIIISTSANSSGMFQLLFEILNLNRSLFYSNEFLLRGGITFGPMFHQGPIAFGPALTNAYDLEQKYAIYPRIILDRALETAFLSVQKTVGIDLTPGPSFKWVRRSPDGFCFLDFLQPITAMSGESLHPEIIRGIVAPNFDVARKMITNGLRAYRYVTLIWDKYRWLAEYFNVVIAEYPEAAIEPISFDWAEDAALSH